MRLERLEEREALHRPQAHSTSRPYREAQVAPTGENAGGGMAAAGNGGSAHTEPPSLPSSFLRLVLVS